MDDLISRWAAIAQIKENYCHWCDHIDLCQSCETQDCIATIEQQVPAVDAAPVVRCSECKYAHMTYDGECKYCDFWQEDGGDALYLDKGFYCAAGERRDGESDG